MTPSALATRVASMLAAKVSVSPIPGAHISRLYLPKYDMRDLETCQVPVAPFRRSASPIVRGGNRTNREHAIGIAPHMKSTAKLGQVDDDEMELFLAFVEWIDDALEGFGTINGHTWSTSSIEPLYDVDLLSDKGIYRSVITTTFRTLRRV